MEQLAKLVLDRGADVDATNKNGLSPLYLAIETENWKLIKLLLRSGARKLKEADMVRAGVHVRNPLDSETPKYTVNIRCSYNDPAKKWRLSTQIFDLALDHEGHRNVVCEVLAAMTTSRG